MSTDPTPTNTRTESQPTAAPDSFHHQAAKLSLVTLLLLFLSGIASRSLREGGVSVVTLEWIRLGIIVSGFLLALLALAGVPKHGAKGLLGRAVSGLFINGLLIFIFATNFMAGRSAAKKRAEDVDQLRGVSKEFASKQLANTNLNDMDGRLEVMDELGTKMDAVSKNLSGEAKLLAQGTASFVKRMKSGLAEYESASKKFDVDKTIDFSNVTVPMELGNRRQTVENFLAANGKLLDLYANIVVVYREEMQKTGMTPSAVEQVLTGMKRRDQTANRVQVAMRHNDKSLGEAAIGLINVLEEQWGKWRFVDDQDAVYVEDDAARKQYSDFIDQLNAASGNTAQLNEKMLTAIEAERKRQAAPEIRQ